jgi:Fe-S cluster assembly iron-binding protein IscA
MRPTDNYLSCRKSLFVFSALCVVIFCGCAEPSPVTVSSEAAEYLRDAMEKRDGFANGFVRIDSGGTAVTGPECALIIDNNFDPATDVRFTSNAIDVVVAREDLDIVQGLTIDFFEHESGAKGLVLQTAGTD